MREPHAELSSLSRRLIWGAAFVPAIVGIAPTYVALKATSIGAPLWVALSWQLLSLSYWIGVAAIGLSAVIPRIRASDRPFTQSIAMALIVHLAMAPPWRWRRG